VRSSDARGRQTTLDWVYPPEVAVKPQGTAGGPSAPPAQGGDQSYGEPGPDLMERVVSRENMLASLRRVEKNKGAAGVDGLKIADLRPYLRLKWPGIREQLLGGSYKPSPVRRVEIPKPDGGVRLLGVPTLLDRLIQQAMLQVLQPIFDPAFSDSSYGFRPGRKAHDAVGRAKRYVEEGLEWVVDTDLEKFFDRVNHDMLMARVARKVKDKLVLRLIRRYLEAGVMVDGVVMGTEEGTPQGGPLSPLLANILLDDLDKELESRGRRFVRYADDRDIYVRTKKAGHRVMESVTTFLEKRLKLKVNREKSAVDRPSKRKFLGFRLFKHRDQVRIGLAPRTLKRVKARIRELTTRGSRNMARRIEELNTYLRGWLGYFSLADTHSVFDGLDGWTRHRLQACLWKQWKRTRTRVRELRALGVPDWLARRIGGSRRGAWYSSGSLMNSALGAAYRQVQGLISLSSTDRELRQPC